MIFPLLCVRILYPLPQLTKALPTRILGASVHVWWGRGEDKEPLEVYMETEARRAPSSGPDSERAQAGVGPGLGPITR